MFGTNNFQANRPGWSSPGQPAPEPGYYADPDELSEESLEMVSGGPVNWPDRWLLDMRRAAAYARGGNNKLSLEFLPPTNAFN